MALSNRERVDRGLTILREALIPFVEREYAARLGNDWLNTINQSLTRE